MTASTSAHRLPSGRRSSATRSRDDVARHQRDRLLAAMTASVAEGGYGAVTVAAVIARAGVSRATFYEQFDDRRACFLAAFDRAVDLLITELERRVPGVDPESRTRAAGFDELVGPYLEVLVSNEALARVLLIDVATLGVDGVLRRAASQERISARLAEVVGASTPEDAFACDALVAAVGSFVTVRLARGDLDAVRDLHTPVVQLGARLFGSRPTEDER